MHKPAAFTLLYLSVSDSLRNLLQEYNARLELHIMQADRICCVLSTYFECWDRVLVSADNNAILGVDLEGFVVE